MRALFVCGKARMRSATAADIAAHWDGIETDFAGLSKAADEKLSVEQLDWADVIVVMQTRQKKRPAELFGGALARKKVVVLNIPDRFRYMEPALVALMTPKLRKLFGKP